MQNAKLAFDAAYAGDYKVLKTLLDAEPGLIEAHDGGGNLLCNVVDALTELWVGHTEFSYQKRYHPVIRLLVEKGISPGSRNAVGYPLCCLLAGLPGYEESFKLLVELGADINFKAYVLEDNSLYEDEKQVDPPVFIFIQNGNAEMVQYLIGKGADLSIKNTAGQTPAEYAKELGLEITTKC